MYGHRQADLDRPSEAEVLRDEWPAFIPGRSMATLVTSGGSPAVATDHGYKAYKQGYKTSSGYLVGLLTLVIIPVKNQ